MLPQRDRCGSGGKSSEPNQLKSLLLSLSYALRGLLVSIYEERNLRIHLSASAWVVWLSFLCPITGGERAALAVCCGVVICGELFNTAVEATVDLLSPDYHPIARRAKDISAAGVLMGAFFAVITGGIVFLTDGRLFAALGLVLASPPSIFLFLTAAAATLTFIFYYPSLMNRFFKNREENNQID